MYPIFCRILAETLGLLLLYLLTQFLVFDYIILHVLYLGHFKEEVYTCT